MKANFTSFRNLSSSINVSNMKYMSSSVPLGENALGLPRLKTEVGCSTRERPFESQINFKLDF